MDVLFLVLTVGCLGGLALLAGLIDRTLDRRGE